MYGSPWTPKEEPKLLAPNRDQLPALVPLAGDDDEPRVQICADERTDEVTVQPLGDHPINSITIATTETELDIIPPTAHKEDCQYLHLQ